MDSIDKLEAENGGQVLNQLVVQLSEENGIRTIKQSKFFTSMGEVYYENLSKEDKAIWDAYVTMITNIKG
jgi:hypothetical protein